MKGGRGLALVAVFLAAAVTLATWTLLDGDRERRFELVYQADADYAARVIQRDLRQRTAAMERIARRWEATGRIPVDIFTLDAENHMHDMPGFRALSYADENHIATYVVPAENSRALGRNIASFGEDRARALEIARDTARSVVTSPIQLVDGSGLGFLLFSPIHIDGAYAGSLNSVFHVGDWIGALFRDTSLAEIGGQYEYVLYLNGNEIAKSPDWQVGAETIAEAAPVTLFGGVWQIMLSPKPPFVASSATYVPEVIAAFMLVLTLMLGGLIAAARQARVAEHVADRANAGLRRANEALAREVRERRDAETRALGASEAKSRFLATMSHEVRTPINAIMGMFELIQTADIPDRQRRQANVGRDAAQRLLHLLSNVLEVSRLQAKAVEFRPENVPMTDLLDQWAMSLEAMVHQSGKSIRHTVVRGAELPAMVHVDDDRLHQIVTNIMDNAVKYTNAGTVELRVTSAEPSGAGVQIDLVDTGVGIPPAQHATVFERFTQVDDPTTRTSSGSGLGLAIASELAKAMGMTLTLVSSTEQGSHFRLFIPEQTTTRRPHDPGAQSRAIADPRGRGRPFDTVSDVRDARVAGA